MLLKFVLYKTNHYFSNITLHSIALLFGSFQGITGVSKSTSGAGFEKLKLYLDTSILNFALTDRPDDKVSRIETEKFLHKIKQGIYEGYISELVTREIITPQEVD